MELLHSAAIRENNKAIIMWCRDRYIGESDWDTALSLPEACLLCLGNLKRDEMEIRVNKQRYEKLGMNKINPILINSITAIHVKAVESIDTLETIMYSLRQQHRNEFFSQNLDYMIPYACIVMLSSIIWFFYVIFCDTQI